MEQDVASLEKAFQAEARIAWVRLAIILFNSLAFIIFANPPGTNEQLAWAIIAGATVYAIWTVVQEPYKGLPAISMSWLFTALDGVLIALWVFATGAYHSPFYVLWYGGLVSIAYRFRLVETLAMGGLYAMLYVLVLLIAGDFFVNAYDVTVRLMYIGFLAWMGGLVGEEVFSQTREKVDLRHLSDASRGVLEATGLEEALDEVLDAALDLVRADAGAIFLLEDEDGDSLDVHARGLDPAYLAAASRAYESMPAGSALLEGAKRVHIPDLETVQVPPEVRELLKNERIRTVAMFPLHREGERVGALALYRREVNPFTEVELELMASLAGHAALALASARLLEDLTESRERYRSLAENVPNFVVTLDKEGLIRFINRTGPELSREETIGRRAGSFLTGGESEGVLDAALSNVLVTGKTAELEVKSTNPEGWYRVQLAPLPKGSSEEVAILVATDITEQKRLVQDLIQSNQDLQQYAFAASHDLKEPLRMVKSYVQLLERSMGDRLTEDEGEYMMYAEEGVERMRELIDGLLTYARVDHEADPFEPVDLDEVLDRVLVDLAPGIKDSGAMIERAELPIVLGDEVQLSQLFQNLVSNAIKFRDGAEPRIRVDATLEGDAWRIAIRDDGVGLAPEYHEDVFTIFKRFHERDRYPGSGIGLAVCKRIVERHGGRIGVTSQEEEGATFWFTLPSLV